MHGKTPVKKLPEKESSSEDTEAVKQQGNGEGDGICRHRLHNNNNNISTRKRFPKSSSRNTKFNTVRVNPTKDATLKLKFPLPDDDSEDAEIQRKIAKKPGASAVNLLKSVSVAEITPTKSKKRLSLNNSTNSIYATPRPFFNNTWKKFCTQERTSCKIYRKLMLLAWRTSKKELRNFRIIVDNQKNQINQLELQNNVLNKLRISESDKRDESQSECKKLRKLYEDVKEEKKLLNEEFENLQNSSEFTQNELKVFTAENQFLSDQSMKMQEIISKKKNEIKSLDEKVKIQEKTISLQQAQIKNLEEKLKTFEKNFKVLEINYNIKENKYAQLKCEFKKQLESHKSISKQLEYLRNEKCDISTKVENLEVQLNDYINSCETLREVNEELVTEVFNISMALDEEKRHNWLRNTKNFAIFTFFALKKITRLLMPVYLNNFQ